MVILYFSFREEETAGEFPFVFDQQFKIAIALSTTHFLVAMYVNIFFFTLFLVVRLIR